MKVEGRLDWTWYDVVSCERHHFVMMDVEGGIM
jgi:hypothetical protein